MDIYHPIYGELCQKISGAKMGIMQFFQKNC